MKRAKKRPSFALAMLAAGALAASVFVGSALAGTIRYQIQASDQYTVTGNGTGIAKLTWNTCLVAGQQYTVNFNVTATATNGGTATWRIIKETGDASGTVTPATVTFQKGKQQSFDATLTFTAMPHQSVVIFRAKLDPDNGIGLGEAAGIMVNACVTEAGSTPPSGTEHPGIGIEKLERIGNHGAFRRGPLVAAVGDTIQYHMVVANTGDVPLVITFSDPRCDAGTLSPAGQQTIAPATSLTYSCSHVLKASDGSPFTNTATASGVTPHGAMVGPVSSSAVVTTTQSGVLGVRHTIKPHQVKPPRRHAAPAHPLGARAHFTG